MKSEPGQDSAGRDGGDTRDSSRAERRVILVDHRIDSRELFLATREVTIAHGGDTYRLRLTAQNKLILTK